MVLLETERCLFDTKAIHFSLPDPKKKIWTLDDCKGEAGTLVMFICNHCPYVKAILEKLVKDAAALRELGVNTVAIMANDIETYPEDSPENMQELAERNNFSFPYLYDETQEIAKAYGAVCTPDFFGYNRELKLQYRGRFDSNIGVKKIEQPAEPELFNAMAQIAKTGFGPEEQTAGIGCSIKWKLPESKR